MLRDYRSLSTSVIIIIIIIIIIIRTTTTLKWKAPGRDQITNVWLKQLTATHQQIDALFNKLIEEDQIP